MTPTDWRTVPVRDLCLGIYDGPHATPKKTNDGPVFLGISSLDSGRLDLELSAHLSETDYAKWTRRVTPQPDDVVFSYETRLGEAAIIPDGLRCCLGRRMALMRPDPAKVDPRFLLYAYLGPDFQETIRERTVHGSTVERILLTEFPDFPIRVPDLRTQRAIARLLKALDDKIELNRRMSLTLESIARAIFKSWFVDFDPVHKKMEGKEGGELAPPPSLVAPLSDSIELSGRKELWRWGALSDVADLNPESWTKSSRPSLLLYVDLSSVKSGRIDGVVKCSNADAPSRAQRILRHGDTVVGTVRPGNRSFALIQRDGLTGSTGFAVLRPRRPEFREIVYLAVTTDESIDHLAQLADGGAYPAVRPEAIASTAIRVPPVDVAVEFHSLVRPLFGQIACNEEQDRLLAGVRERLLPRLLSGALVRVPA